MKLQYSQDALEDLERLRAFIAAHNPTAANRISYRLIEGVQALKRHPGLGHSVQKAPDPESIRDLVLGDYIVRYLILAERVVVLRIWHHREQER